MSTSCTKLEPAAALEDALPFAGEDHHVDGRDQHLARDPSARDSLGQRILRAAGRAASARSRAPHLPAHAVPRAHRRQSARVLWSRIDGITDRVEVVVLDRSSSAKNSGVFSMRAFSFAAAIASVHSRLRVVEVDPLRLSVVELQIGVDLLAQRLRWRPAARRAARCTVFGAQTRKRLTPGAPSWPGASVFAGPEAQPNAARQRKERPTSQTHGRGIRTQPPASRSSAVRSQFDRAIESFTRARRGARSRRGARGSTRSGRRADRTGARASDRGSTPSGSPRGRGRGARSRCRARAGPWRTWRPCIAQWPYTMP